MAFFLVISIVPKIDTTVDIPWVSVQPSNSLREAIQPDGLGRFDLALGTKCGEHSFLNLPNFLIHKLDVLARVHVSASEFGFNIEELADVPKRKAPMSTRSLRPGLGEGEHDDLGGVVLAVLVETGLVVPVPAEGRGAGLLAPVLHANKIISPALKPVLPSPTPIIIPRAHVNAVPELDSQQAQEAQQENSQEASQDGREILRHGHGPGGRVDHGRTPAPRRHCCPVVGRI